jgi:hypothetical protein
MQLQRLRVATGFAALSLAACSATGTNPDKVSQANVGASVLTFTVGTANIYGTAKGLNVYAAFRQPNGALNPGSSAALVSEPVLSGPLAGNLPAAGSASALDATSTVFSGPAPGESASLGFTAQGGSSLSSFGTSGGVSGLGIEPFNYNNQNGVPATSVPYPVPLFDPTGDPNALVPWGGPPGFDPDGRGLGRGVYDGNTFPGGVLGVSEGLDVFYGVTPSASSAYTLTVTVPATSTAPTTLSQSASFASAASAAFQLPLVPPPAPTFDGSGGASFTATFPTGVTEEYIQVVDIGPAGAAGMGCNGAAPAKSGTPLFYTLVVKPATAEPVAITAANGPSGKPAAICTAAQNTAAAGAATPGDTVTVQVLGFDYDAYAASYPASLKMPSPPISGQTDISVSAPATFTSP